MTWRVSVFGTGYLGATHAAGMAELGHDVVGVDIDAAKVATLARGEVPFFEPGLPELISKHVATGRLRFTTDAREAADADAHVQTERDAAVLGRGDSVFVADSEGRLHIEASGVVVVASVPVPRG